MTYRRSRARCAFELQLDQSMKELRPLYRFAQGAGGTGATRLLGAYYVFAFAQLEIYVKSFVEDLLSTVDASTPPFEKWPDLMLGYFLHKTQSLGSDYRRFATSEDEGALLDQISKVARGLAAWSGGGGVPAPVQSVEFLEKKKYPSPKNLPQLFRRLGIKQIWTVVSAAGRMNSELILTSLNDLRTDIAHEGKVPPGFGMTDFRGRVDQMSRFVAALDRGVAGYFCSNVVSRAAWNNHMV